MVKAGVACLSASLALLSVSSLAQSGLQIGFDGVQAPQRALRLGVGDWRLSMSVAQPGSALSRTRLSGDYYLTGPGFGGELFSGGLRLTSGLASGPRDGTASLPASRLEGGLKWGPHEVGGWLSERPGARVTLPYIGLGYTSLSLREGWGLTADIGLGGQRPGERVRFGAGNGAAAQFQRLLNEMRLSPVIQLGVSYSF